MIRSQNCWVTLTCWILIHYGHHCLIDKDMAAAFPNANPTFYEGCQTKNLGFFVFFDKNLPMPPKTPGDLLFVIRAFHNVIQLLFLFPWDMLPLRQLSQESLDTCTSGKAPDRHMKGLSRCTGVLPTKRRTLVLSQYVSGEQLGSGICIFEFHKKV